MFFLSVGTLLFACIRQRAPDEKEAALLAEDSKGRSLKGLYPAGLFLSGAVFPLRNVPKDLRLYLLNHENRVRSKLEELYGSTNLSAAVSLHYAQRWAFALTAAVLLSFFAVVLRLQGDSLSALVLALGVPVGACAVTFLADNELDKKVEKNK